MSIKIAVQTLSKTTTHFLILQFNCKMSPLGPKLQQSVGVLGNLSMAKILQTLSAKSLRLSAAFIDSLNLGGGQLFMLGFPFVLRLHKQVLQFCLGRQTCLVTGHENSVGDPSQRKLHMGVILGGA